MQEQWSTLEKKIHSMDKWGLSQYRSHLLLWSWMNLENIEPNITLNYAWTEVLCFMFFYNTSFFILGRENLKKKKERLCLHNYPGTKYRGRSEHWPSVSLRELTAHKNKSPSFAEKSKSHEHVSGRFVDKHRPGFTADIALSPQVPR